MGLEGVENSSPLKPFSLSNCRTVTMSLVYRWVNTPFSKVLMNLLTHDPWRSP